MQAADYTMLTGAGLMALTLLLVLVDMALPDRNVLDFKRQRILTVAVFTLFAASILLRHCV